MKLEYSADRAKKLKVWKRNRDNCAGADVVKEAPRAYVRQRESVTDEDYSSIMDATEYYAMAQRTLQSFVGLVFRKEPIFDGRNLFPQAISIEGHSAEDFARLLLREYLITNDGGILIDTPDTPEGATQADLEKLNSYPYLVHYPAESIREIRHRVINGRKRLVYVRMVEDDTHGRELELIDGRVRATVWTCVDKQWFSETVEPRVAGEYLNEIPFLPLNDGDTCAAMDGLCALNVVHFNLSYNLASALAWLCIPIPYIFGIKEDVEIKMHYGTFIRADNENAKTGFLQHSGQGIDDIRQEKMGIEQHASTMGSRLLTNEKAVSENPEVVARRQAGENSVLANNSRHISAIMTRALRTQAFMMRKPIDGVRYTLSTNFVPATVDPALLAQWMAMKQAGLLPSEAYFENLKKADQIDDSWDYETWRAAIDIEGGPAN